MESKKYNISNPNITITEEEFDEMVEFNIGLMCDCVPYDDPEYAHKVRMLSAMLTEMQLDPSLHNGY